MAEEADPKGTGFPSIVTVVATTVTLVGTVLTTLGISTGVITALLRNNKAQTLFALLVTLLGILLGIVSTFITRGASDQTTQARSIAAIVSLAVFFGGLGWL